MFVKSDTPWGVFALENQLKKENTLELTAQEKSFRS